MIGMKAFRTRWTAALLAALASAASAGTAPAAAQHQHAHPPAAGARADSATLPYNERYAWTEADAHFMSSMVGHHAQAIVMARLAPTRAAANSVRILAERIINAQEDEIATMQTWLRDRDLPVPDAEAHAGMDHGPGGHHGALMPGMLTPEQMAQLERASGAEFDRLFLTFMIQHHRGAVAMVTQLFGTPGAGQDEAVFKFATDVNVDQATEIARMQRMLADLLFGSAAP
jgi:uncharacterized protein (DUF305 family)